MKVGKAYTAEQLHRIYSLQIRICALHGLALTSAEGMSAGWRLLTELSGSETEEVMLWKFVS